jgi:DNA topoisomerase-1
VAHDGKYASLESPDDVFTIGLNHAVTVLAEKKAKGGGRRGPQALKELGQDGDGNTIKVLKGRYGPYVSDGDINATIPDGNDPMEVTLEQALALIAERVAKGGGKKKKKKTTPKPKPEAKSEAVAKKPAAKKTVVKKKTAAKAKKKPEPVAGE